MKNRGKRTAFLAALLAMSSLLSACGSSGNNTGAWIAIIIMVFIAVFAATSGVVYLVLQRILPPEEEQPHTARPTQRRREEIDDVTQPLLRPRSQVTRTSQSYTGEWVCPRDHSRNTGPYCVACGAPRPQRQSTSQPTRTASSTAQPTRTGEQTRYTAQNWQGYSPAPTGTAQSRSQAATSNGNTQPRTQATAGTAQVRTQSPSPTGTAQPRTQAATSQQERPYTGKFARKEPEPVQEADTATDPEYDAELLAAIFREAEQGTDET